MSRAADVLAVHAIKAASDYDIVRGDFDDALFEAFWGYVALGGGRSSINAGRQAVAYAVPAAFEAGYAEAGGDAAEMEPEDSDWATAKQAEQLDYVVDSFEALKPTRGEADEDAVGLRVGAWLSMLDGVYSEGKLRGDRNKMLTFDGDDGKESCAECKRYKGERHSAAWWLKRDLVRRNGNDNFGCGRWENCFHNLFDDDGEEYTA